MFARKSRLKTIVCALMLLCAPALYAEDKNDAPSKEQVKSEKIEAGRNFSRNQQADEHQRRKNIINRANDTFSLLGAELALHKGDPGLALATYMAMLDRTRDSEVAERAMDMAVNLGAYEYAEAVYQRWVKLEPTPGPALKRISWMRDMVRGEYGDARNGFDAALEGANEEQRSRIFLLVAQIAAQNPAVAQLMDDTVHKRAKSYPELPEAVIADAILSALNDKAADSVQALQKLAQLDSEILPPTHLTLRLIGQRRPEIINRFFAETDTSKLSPVWQELQIEALIYADKKDEAQRFLQKLLEKQPNADLYIQAALLSSSRKAPLEETMDYLTKAYRHGTQEQQSRAAVIATLRNGDNKKFAEAREWANKIQAPDFRFDKTVLMASLNLEEGKWRQAAAEIKRARAMTSRQGRFFDENHLLQIQLLVIGQYDNPQQALQELNLLHDQIARRPNNAENLSAVLYQRALVYVDKLNRPEKAIADLRRYLELNPDNPNGQNALGYTMLTMPNPKVDEAFELIRAAYEQEPEEPAINDSLGWAYFLKGDAETALPYLQYAFKMQGDAEVSAHLGEVLWHLGKKEQAVETFEKGWKAGGNIRVLQNTMRRLGVPLPESGQPAVKDKKVSKPAAVRKK